MQTARCRASLVAVFVFISVVPWDVRGQQVGSDSASPGALTIACGDLPGDAAALVAVRAEIEADCDCSSRGRARYLRCVAKVTRAAVSNGSLRGECRPLVQDCARESTCGRRQAVTCCRTDA